MVAWSAWGIVGLSCMEPGVASVGGCRSITSAVVEGCGFVGERRELVELCWFEADIRGGGVGTQFVAGLSADDDGGDRRAGEQPGERDLVRAQPPRAAEPVDV